MSIRATGSLLLAADASSNPARGHARTALFLGTALGCSIAVLSLTAPTAAFAADECGAPSVSGDTATATCTGPTYPAGITYIAPPLDNLRVVVDPGVTVTNIGAGITATGWAGYYAAVVTASGDTITAGTDGVDVFASGGGGAIIENGATVYAGVRGLWANSDTGPVDVINTGALHVSGANFYTDGIVAGYTTGTAYVNNSGAITVSNSVGRAYGIYAAALLSTNIINDAPITVSGVGNAYGIDVAQVGTEGYVTSTGDMNVSSSAGTAYGVYMKETGTADITNTGNVVVSGVAAVGFSDYSKFGPADISQTGTTTVDATTGNATGFYAHGYSANVTAVGDIVAYSSGGYATGVHAVATGTAGAFYSTVSVTGNVTAIGATGAMGVYASGADGAHVTVTGDVSAISNGYATGVFAQTTSAGTTSVSVGGNVTALSNLGSAYGVIAENTSAAGDANVTVGGAVTARSYATAGLYGAVGVTGFTTGAGNVSITVGGPINASGLIAAGALGVSYGGGNVTVTVGDVTVNQSGATAADGGSGIRTYTSGTTTITAGNVSTTGAYTDAIKAGEYVGGHAYGGDVSVTANSVHTTGAYSAGVNVVGLGNATVILGSAITTGDYSDGVAVAVAGNVNVTTNGYSRTSGYKSDVVYAATTGAGNVTVTNNGALYADNGVGIHVNSANAATIHNTGYVYGARGAIVANTATGLTINNDAGGEIWGGGGYAIGATGAGSVTINNAGSIYGYANLATAANTVNNPGTWFAYGTSNFGTGADVFNNSGTVDVAPFSSAATAVVWNGLTTFNNTGLVDLRNGHTGDTFTLTGANWVGGAGSRLGVDVSLSPSLSADELIIGGAASGTTNVLINDLSPAGPGTLNFTGVPVVHAGSGSAGAFVAPTIQKGFVNYELSFNPSTVTWSVVGLPGQSAFEMVKVPEMAEGFWRRSGDAWSAREQEIRDSVWGATPTRGEGWEMWAQAQIGGERLGGVTDYTINGFSFAPNLRTDTDWRGFQVGADEMLGGGWMWGVTSGFLEQNTDFRGFHDSFDLQGWNIGAYAGFTSGHFFLNGLVKGDWYQLRANMLSVPAYQSFNGNSWGLKGETGFRFGTGAFYIEPLGDISWTSNHLDDANFHFLATDFTYSNTDSGRGRLGARFGSQWGSVMPYVGVYWEDTWDDQGRVTMITSGGCPAACTTISDVRPGSYGMVDFGFTTASWHGLEGFVKGEDEFGSHINGFLGRLGVRWRW
jgi:hypothetical protein